MYYTRQVSRYKNLSINSHTLTIIQVCQPEEGIDSVSENEACHIFHNYDLYRRNETSPFTMRSSHISKELVKFYISLQ